MIRPLVLGVVFWSILLAPAAAGAQGLLVTGRVVDATDAAVPRARVRLLDPSGGELAAVLTDEEGRFAFGRPCPGTCTVEASASGFRPARRAASSGPLRLVLEPAPIREHIVVTPTRTSAPAGQVGAAVSLVTAEDLAARQARLVAEVLPTLPGVIVVRTGGRGTLTSLFVRGGESTYNRVLLDGIPLNEPGGVFNFSHLTTEQIDRIEVVRGAHSALFGSDAMASVVQLFTRHDRRTAGRPEIVLSGEGGGYATRRASATIAGRAGSASYTVALSRFVTDNREPNNAFRTTTVSTSLEVPLGAAGTLRVIGRGELGRTGTPGPTAFGRPDRDAFFRRRDGVGGATLTRQVGARWSARWTYGLAVSHQASTNLQIDPPFVPRYGDRAAPFLWFDFPFDTGTDLRRHYLSHQSDWRLRRAAGRGGDHLLTVVLDWDGERGVLQNRLAGTAIRAARNNFGGSLQHQALWDRVSLTAGFRVEDNASFGVAAVPRGTAAYLARRGAGRFGATRLRASAGLGIKEPTLVQSFSPSPFFLGNPALAPERSRSLEVGVEQRWWDDRGRVEITWFANRFRNLISTRTTSVVPFRAQFFNVGRTRARGVETQVELAPRPGLGMRASYTWLDSRVLRSTAPTNPVFREGARLFRRPVHSGSLQVFGDWRRLAVSLTGIFVGRRVDSDFVGLEPPLTSNAGYALWHLTASYRVGRRLTWFVALDNLTDADYMEPLGFPALGRVGRVGGRVTF